MTFATAYLLGRSFFTALICLLALGMLYELLKLLEFSTVLTWILVSSATLSFYVEFFTLNTPSSWNAITYVAPIALIIVATCRALFYGYLGERLSGALIALYGVSIILIGFSNLVTFPDRALALITVVAFIDVASFTGGKFLGKLPIMGYRIFRKTSPNKTLGGLLFGMVAAAVGLLILDSFSPINLLLLVTGAVLGDYAESWVKRWARVKDAGKILPGFGGLLDRFDSVLLLAPLVGFLF